MDAGWRQQIRNFRVTVTLQNNKRSCKISFKKAIIMIVAKLKDAMDIKDCLSPCFTGCKLQIDSEMRYLCLESKMQKHTCPNFALDMP